MQGRLCRRRAPRFEPDSNAERLAALEEGAADSHALYRLDEDSNSAWLERMSPRADGASSEPSLPMDPAERAIHELCPVDWELWRATA